MLCEALVVLLLSKILKTQKFKLKTSNKHSNRQNGQRLGLTIQNIVWHMREVEHADTATNAVTACFSVYKRLTRAFEYQLQHSAN